MTQPTENVNHSESLATMVGTIVTLISLIVVFISYGYNLIQFYSFPQEIQDFFENTFLGKISHGQMDEIQLYITFFVAVHLIRIHFGLNFISYDESFAKVRAEIEERNKKKKRRIEFFLRIILLASLQVLNFALWRADFVFICLLLIFQGLIIIFYNINYWNQLFKADNEFKANYFILIGDLTFLVTGILLSIESYFWFKKLVIFMVGGYTAIFIGELFSQYLRSLKLLFIDIKLQLKNV